jgi:hypothetical protein
MRHEGMYAFRWDPPLAFEVQLVAVILTKEDSDTSGK